MQLQVLKSKIHRAVVTQTELDYVGSITIDRQLMDAVGLYVHEKVQVLNINNGARFETYVIEGKAGQKDICINGAAARLAQKGDRVIIISYGIVDEKEIIDWKPRIVSINDQNEIE
ncbi:MAG: aspartate 1-decarboxylase [Candidatus Marinimicrobia bacterium]|nr:aspartate 1-decarboxylase [Candidatus Neomarinimicrobiota bacterium]